MYLTSNQIFEILKRRYSNILFCNVFFFLTRMSLYTALYFDRTINYRTRLSQLFILLSTQMIIDQFLLIGKSPPLRL